MSETHSQGDPEHRPTFEIALVMAGAVSAGAYTAGVLDFLLEALSEWHHPTKPPPDVDPKNWPPHSVKIRVMTGASAGGISAALLTRMFDDPPPRPKSPRTSLLYRAWVEQIDIRPMLGRRDLDRDPVVTSLFDATPLQEIADAAIPEFSHSVKVEPCPYVSETLDVVLTLTNLRGVPYRLEITENANDLNLNEIRFLHADELRFQRVARSSVIHESGVTRLTPGDRGTPGWQLLKTAALATSAFPGAFPPRMITRLTTDYVDRVHYPAHVADTTHPPNSTADEPAPARKPGDPVPPFWAARLRDQAFYTFPSVDGGTMYNQPFERARLILASAPDPNHPHARSKKEGAPVFNPHSAERAFRAVIMIDPFPIQTDSPEADGEIAAPFGLLVLAKRLIGALVAQARFRPEELLLTTDPNIFSRFLIAPDRGDPTRSHNFHSERGSIACGSLGGFGGFLSRAFREHDYQLGRRNCQKFLRDWFVLSGKNRIFLGKPLSTRRLFPPSPVCGLADAIPIIPLLDLMNEDEPLPTWPTMSGAEVDRLVDGFTPDLLDQRPPTRGIRHRLDDLVGILLSNLPIENRIFRSLARAYFKVGYCLKGRTYLLNSIRESIKKGLKDNGQYGEE